MSADYNSFKLLIINSHKIIDDLSILTDSMKETKRKLEFK